MTQRLIYEQHMHTPLCNHAEGEPEDYAAVAERRGLAGIVVTCHNPMPEDYGHGAGRMLEEEIDIYLALVERARRAFEGRIDVRPGLECDFFPGYERYVERQLEPLGLDHVLGSVHCHLPIWRNRFLAHEPLDTQRNYFDQLAASAETGLFDTLAHPDLVKNLTPAHWDVRRIMPDIQRALDRIADTGVAMELNTSGLLKHIPEMNPGPEILRQMRQRDIPVVVGADAHVPHRAAAHYEQAYDQIEAAGYTHVSYFLRRTRHDLPLAAARESLLLASALPTASRS